MSMLSYVIGAENLFGALMVVFILESFPLNLLVAWLFYAYGDLTQFPSFVFLMAAALSSVSYFQWFHIVPRIAAFFQNKLARHDRQIEILIKNKALKELEESSEDWAVSWYEKEKYSPVERVFLQDPK